MKAPTVTEPLCRAGAPQIRLAFGGFLDESARRQTPAGRIPCQAGRPATHVPAFSFLRSRRARQLRSRLTAGVPINVDTMSNPLNREMRQFAALCKSSDGSAEPRRERSLHLSMNRAAKAPGCPQYASSESGRSKRGRLVQTASVN